MPDLGLILRGMKQCPHFKFESSSQTSQLIHPVLSTRQFFSLCNSTFYTQNPVQSCGASILLLPRFKDLQKQFQKKHTTCNLIFIFPTLQDRHTSSFHGAPKDSSTSSKAEAPPVSFMAWFTVHLSPQHVPCVARHQGQQESSAAKSVTEKGHKPFDCPCLGVRGLCLECQLGPEPQLTHPGSLQRRQE